MSSFALSRVFKVEDKPNETPYYGLPSLHTLSLTVQSKYSVEFDRAIILPTVVKDLIFKYAESSKEDYVSEAEYLMNRCYENFSAASEIRYAPGYEKSATTVTNRQMPGKAQNLTQRMVELWNNNIRPSSGQFIFVGDTLDSQKLYEAIKYHFFKKDNREECESLEKMMGSSHWMEYETRREFYKVCLNAQVSEPEITAALSELSLLETPESIAGEIEKSSCANMASSISQ